MERDLNKLAAEIHADNSRWWHDLETGERLNRNKGELLMLCVSELAECMEGERKSKPNAPVMDDHLPERVMAEVELADTLIRIFDLAGGFGLKLHNVSVGYEIDNRGEILLRIVSRITDAYWGAMNDDSDFVEDALSYAVGAIYGYAAKFGYDVDGAMAEKRAYNKVRVDHTKEARMAEGGKAW